MNEENVNVIKNIYAAFGRGDVQGIVDCCTDDVLWRTHLNSVVPWAGNYDGRENVPRFFAGINDSVETTAFEPQEWIADGDTVVSLGQYGCRVRSTGRESMSRWVFIWKLHDRKVCSYEQFHDSAIEDIFRDQ